MKTVKKAAEILFENLGSVYCDTCKTELGEEACDYCHRKSMNWGISEAFAYELAKEICK